MPSSDLSKPEVVDYATTMAIIYSMVKQDYTMQVITLRLPLFTSLSTVIDLCWARLLQFSGPCL